VPNIEGVGEMLQIEIHCPVHGEIEILELPDGYKDFEGEVKCPTPLTNYKTGANLRIKIKDNKLVTVERAS